MLCAVLVPVMFAIAAALAAVRWSHVLARIAGCVLPFDVTWSVRTTRPVVALSFDDGPHEATTPHLLDVLSRYDAHATFFLIGSRVLGHESLVEQITEAGNELGNHAMFDTPSVALSIAEFERQLIQNHSLLERFAPVTLFRPASGWFTPSMLATLAAHGYRCVLGTVTTFDAQHRRPRLQARQLLSRVRPGSIIVLHEGAPQRAGVVVLADIMLSELTRRGYRVLTVSELLHATATVTGDRHIPRLWRRRGGSCGARSGHGSFS